MNPFVQGDYICATDTYTLIWFNQELLLQESYQALSNDELTPNVQRIINQIIPNCDAWITSDYLSDKINNAHKYLDTIDITCPECTGTGLVDYTYTDNDLIEYEFESECPVCEGDGETDITRKLLIELQGKRFNLMFIERLYKTATMLDAELLHLYYHDDMKIGFQIGNCHILIMKTSAGILPNGELSDGIHVININGTDHAKS